MTVEEYDVVVLGTGAAGLTAPLSGLYAARNAMASVMGMTYGGHGGTLGPALVFGYRAGRDAAARARQAAPSLAATARE
jgi:succinate dehydrogenase/fumarate reductase flavoprotein subunit